MNHDRLDSGRLRLTTNGLAAQRKPSAEVIRDLWQRWISHAVIDEFSRIDAIKGQHARNVRSAARTAVRSSQQRRPTACRMTGSASMPTRNHATQEAESADHAQRYGAQRRRIPSQHQAQRPAGRERPPDLTVAATEPLDASDELLLSAYTERATDQVWTLSRYSLLSALDAGRDLWELTTS